MEKTKKKVIPNYRISRTWGQVSICIKDTFFFSLVCVEKEQDGSWLIMHMNFHTGFFFFFFGVDFQLILFFLAKGNF